MSLKVENLEKNMIKMTIEVEAAEFDKALNKVYQQNKAKYSIPGFRKGKAPRKMIESMYGKGVFYEDAANEVIPGAYEKALDEYKGKEIVSRPEVDPVQIGEGENFIFTAEVAVKPDVTLGQYKGVEAEKVEAEVTEAEVDAEIEKERETNSREIDVDDRPVQDGDEVILDFEGFKDGVAFEGGKGEDYPLTIGSGSFIPGFEEQLIGAEIDKELEVNVTFPEDYQAEDLAGAAAVFKCTVKQIKVKELPDLDDEFASEVSEFDTMEEYREDVKKQLQEKKEADVKRAKENAVVDAVVANAEMEIPAPMLEYQQRQMIEDFAQRIQSQGLSFEQYLQFTNSTMSNMMDQVKPQAEQRIKSSLVLEAVAVAEQIEVTDEEYKEELERMSKEYSMEVDAIETALGEGGEKQVKDDLAINKAVQFLVENAVEVEPAETEAEDAEAEENEAEAAE
ncbi:MAG: trigger factor [Lachnospiraceae bacterium]|nr:trigger factor [Lachnospiraceae bacterium]